MSAAEDKILLDVRGLRTYYPIRQGGLLNRVGWVRSVDDVSLQIRPGETLGLVGESGCGKTTLARSILRLVEPREGEVIFDGRDILKLSHHDLRRARADLQIMFQDPYGSLDPRTHVADTVAEGLRVRGRLTAAERARQVDEALDVVGLGSKIGSRYPHELSGGQRQRVGIARALVLRPKLVVCDEPVSALDVSVQSQVLNLLKDLQVEFGLAYLFIAHDLGVVEYISDRVGVMYLGKLVELAPAEELYRDPRMPYTQALLSAIPTVDPALRRERITLRGELPSPLNPPSGCPFRSRCWRAEEVCAQAAPPLREVKPGHWAACHFA